MKKRRALNTRERGLPYNDSRVHHSVCQGLSLVPIHRDTQIDLKTEKGGVVKGHSKKRRKQERKRKRRLKSQTSVQLGLLLVPIHGDTQIDLKTEKGGVVKEHSKKRSKQKIKRKRKRKRRLKSEVGVQLGLSLVPIHGGTQIDLKTEKKCVVKGPSK